MALQEDPTKTFGSTSYFKNKDDQRKAVNETRQAERQKRIATQLLRRNMKKSMRAGGDGGNFMQAAKLGKLDIFGSNGLGEEAGAAMRRARYDVDQNFQAAAKAKAMEESKKGNAGQTPAINTGATTQTGSTPQAGVVPTANTTPPPLVSSQVATQPADSKSVLTRPDWADEVKNDRTFKDVDFNDPGTLARLQGKTRAEAYDMLRKDQAASFMSGASRAGASMIADEKSQQEAAIKLAAEAQAKKEKGIFDSKVKDKVDTAIMNSATFLDRDPDGGILRTSKADTEAYNSARETATMINNLANNLSDENFQLMGTTREKFLQKATQNDFGSNEFQTPSADYYSMSLEEQVADLQKRSKDYDSGMSPPIGTVKQYEYKLSDNGDIVVELNPSYKSKEAETYEQLKFESQGGASTLMKNTRDLVLAEDKAKQQRLDKLALDRAQYQEQRIRDQQAKAAASTMFGTGS
jgi:hypothetical protein